MKSTNESQAPKIKIRLLHYTQETGGKNGEICAPWATKPLWIIDDLRGILTSPERTGRWREPDFNMRNFQL